MSGVYNSETIENKRETVNNLIENSFGSRYKGDYSSRIKVMGEGIGRILERKNCLKVIVGENSTLKRILTLGLTRKIKGYAGVLNKDGSEITILENFSEEAKRYAELYLPEFKKKVKVYVASQEEVHDMVYPPRSPPLS